MGFSRKKSEKYDDRENSSGSRKIFMHPGTIDEEPDSMDSIMSNPNLLPLTIVPNLVRSSTCGSGFSRQGSCRTRENTFSAAPKQAQFDKDNTFLVECYSPQPGTSTSAAVPNNSFETLFDSTAAELSDDDLEVVLEKEVGPQKKNKKNSESKLCRTSPEAIEKILGRMDNHYDILKQYHIQPAQSLPVFTPGFNFAMGVEEEIKTWSEEEQHSVYLNWRNGVAEERAKRQAKLNK